VLESGLIEEARDRYVLRGPLRPLAIPATLYGSLMARLDRLAAAKEVAQLAACIGREFSHELLAAVSPLDTDALAAALDQLAASELIHHQGAASAASYVFRHALLQEAAYQTLLRSRRQELHARVARTVEARFPEITARQPEWLRTTTRRRVSLNPPRPAGLRRRSARRQLTPCARLRCTWRGAWRCWRCRRLPEATREHPARRRGSSRRWSCLGTSRA
jgi:hypothetical protein